MSKEYYKRFRPASLKTVCGQSAAVSQVRNLLASENMPHTWLLYGPSGCGKTTIARIIAKELEVHEDDVVEVNAANSKGIDMVRDIVTSMGFRALKSKYRVYIIDEAHQLTTAAQDSFLKPLEDTPKHVIFILCTNNPDKLRPTIRSRCTEIGLGSLSAAELMKVVNRVIDKEKLTLDKEVIQKLIEVADGGARKALVLLQQIAGLDKAEAMSTLTKADAQAVGIDLCRALISRKPWKDVASILKRMDQDPEEVRRQVLGYGAAILLSGKPDQRAGLILEAFAEPLYNTGKPGLVLAAFNVSGAK